MKCVMEVIRDRPLTVRFALVNPPDASSPQLVPRTLVPLGLFVTLEVADSAGNQLYRSEVPKQKPKLHPQKAESYLSLKPDETFGATFTVDQDELDLRPGSYRLSATYTNGIFTGPDSGPIGTVTCTCQQTLTISLDH